MNLFRSVSTEWVEVIADDTPIDRRRITYPLWAMTILAWIDNGRSGNIILRLLAWCVVWLSKPQVEIQSLSVGQAKKLRRLIRRKKSGGKVYDNTRNTTKVIYKKASGE